MTVTSKSSHAARRARPGAGTREERPGLQIGRLFVEPNALDLNPVVAAPVDPRYKNTAPAGKQGVGKAAPGFFLDARCAVGQDPDEPAADRLAGGQGFAPEGKPRK